MEEWQIVNIFPVEDYFMRALKELEIEGGIIPAHMTHGWHSL
ncbi:hypothetical protein [Sporosarcina cascadiensis]|nr:hypothetical protein [Sporosarcina cascadiensis]